MFDFLFFYSFPSHDRIAVSTSRGDYWDRVEAHDTVTVDGHVSRYGGDDRTDTVRRWTNAIRSHASPRAVGLHFRLQEHVLGLRGAALRRRGECNI